MAFVLKIGFLSFWLIALAHQCDQQRSAETTEDYVEITDEMPADDVAKEESNQAGTATEEISFEACSEFTRQVLITHCGSCHQSTLPTHKAGAIAVFDLDKNELWHENLSGHDLPGIANRMLSKSDLSDEQKEAISVFVKLKGEQLHH